MTFTPDVIDVVSWDVNLSMDGGATANVLLANSAAKYDPADLTWEQIELFTDIDSTIRKWFHGVVMNAQPTFDALGNEQIALQCASFFGTLEKKPAFTKEFDNANAQTVLEALVTTYGSISSDFVDFSTSDKSGSGFEWTRIIVVENSITEALRLITQANMQEMFVRSDGVLVAEEYTVGSDPVFDLDDKYIISAAASSNSDDPYSRVRVRGGWEDQSDPALATTLYTGNFDFHFSASSLGIQQLVTFQSTQPDYVWQSAEYTSTTPGVTASFVGLDSFYPNTATIKFVFSTWWLPGDYSVNLTVTGNKERESQIESFGVGLRPNPKPSNAQILGSVGAVSTPTTRIQQIAQRSQLSAVEPERDRIDIEVSDATLVSRFGVRWREIDNSYILSEAIATLIGNRALLEYKQAENTWRVRTSYIPSLLTELDLNRRVTFYPPGNITQVDGVVRGLGISYNATSAEVTMALDIEQFAP